MTQYFVGLDLGSYSVKATIIRQGFKGGEVVFSGAEPVELASDGSSGLQNIIEAANRIKERFPIADASFYCSVPGEWASVRSVTLPLSAARKASEILAFELDELLPYDVEDAVFDYVEQSRTHDEITYQIAAVKVEQIEDILNLLAEIRIDPVEISISPLCYVPWFVDSGIVDNVVGIVDVGHFRTNVIINGDSFFTCRTILRGSRDITAFLAQKHNVDFSSASKMKEMPGALQSGETIDSLSTLTREIWQTILGHVADGGKEINKILICGGGSLDDMLADSLAKKSELCIEKVALPFHMASDCKNENIPSEQMILSQCLAGLGVIKKERKFNLRKGSLASKGETDAIQRKVVSMIICVVAILASWIFYSLAQYNVVSKQVDIARKKLEDETMKILGEPMVNRGIIEQRMGVSVAEASPVPRRDAFDVLVEISKRIPEAVVHDVEHLEIRQRQTKIQALVNPDLIDDSSLGEEQDLSPTDFIKSRLAQFDECFVGFRIPRVRTINNRQQYTMEIDSKCP